MSSFKILSFDGGGVRGAFSARVLKNICDEFPMLLEKTHLFSGTSTGALIALALCSGKNSIDVDNLYSYKNTKYIFDKWHIPLFRPKYNNTHLKKLLINEFGTPLKIGDLNKLVVVPSFNLSGYDTDNWEVVFFHNIFKNKTENERVIDAALASSAAPTFFPSHKNFIDGGVANNSPALSSLFLALDSFKYKYNINEYKVISIGTGLNPNRILRNTSKWGIAQWSLNPFISQRTPLLSIVGDGMIEVEDYYCKKLLGKNYLKINAEFDHTIEIDDFSQVEYMKKIADSMDYTEIFNFIKNVYLKD